MISIHVVLNYLTCNLCDVTADVINDARGKRYKENLIHHCNSFIIRHHHNSS